MSVTAIKDIVSGLTRKDQIQLAMHILQNIANEETGENAWLTEEVETELARRKAAVLSDETRLLSHEEVMQSIKRK